MTEKPNPGSAEAVDLGCLCARMDNAHGKGIILNGERVWWITADCPIHGNPDHDLTGFLVHEDELPHSENDA
jgi:hypothetical protein